MNLLNSSEEGETSTFVLNGEWALLGKLSCGRRPQYVCTETLEHSLGSPLSLRINFAEILLRKHQKKPTTKIPKIIHTNLALLVFSKIVQKHNNLRMLIHQVGGRLYNSFATLSYKCVRSISFQNKNPN